MVHIGVDMHTRTGNGLCSDLRPQNDHVIELAAKLLKMIILFGKVAEMKKIKRGTQFILPMFLKNVLDSTVLI